MSIRAVAALCLVLGAAGCAVAPPSEQPSRAPFPQAEPPERLVQTTSGADPRTVARNFVSVVNAVEPVAERECRRRAPRLNCDFRIVVDDRPGQQANAFQTLDREGRPIIAFTLALIAEVRNRDELAFVMAHEAAHHIAGHLGRQEQNANVGAAVFGELAGVLGRTTEEQLRLARELGAAVGARSYSRSFELEADRLGTIITMQAGYDPLLGAEFFFRIPDPGDRFLGTHPPNAERIAVVQQTVAGL